MIMIALRFLAVTLCAIVVFGIGNLSAGAAGGGAPVLRGAVTVSTDIVTLGDLFENAGPLSPVAVFRAPDPGETGTVNALRVAQAARAHGLDWNAAAGPFEVTVTRASTEIPLDAIVAVIDGALRDKLTLDTDAELAITLDAAARPLHLPSGDDSAIAVTRADLYTNGTFAVTLAAGSTSATYRGEAVESVRIPVLNRDVARGETIAPGDIELRAVARQRLTARDLVTDTAAVIAKAARRNLRAGSTLREGDLEEPRLVRRGDLVTIEYAAPGLLLSVRGKALADGAIDEEVAVLNTQSNRVIQTQVTGVARVAVHPVDAPVATRTAAVTQ